MHALFLHVSSHPEGDGAVGLPPVRMMRQRDALAERGWETETIDFIRLRAPPIGNFVQRAQLFRHMTQAMVVSGLRASKPDIMITHDIETLPAAVKITCKLGIPLIYDSHENWPALISHNSKFEALVARFVEDRALRDVSHVFTSSDSTAARFKKVGKKTTVLYNGHSDHDVVLMDRDEARIKLGYWPNDFVMGFAGNLHEITTKGDIANTLFRAMWKLPENVKILIIGGPDSIARFLAKRAKRMGLEKRVKVHGHMPYKNLSPYYAAMDLGLVLLRPLPSYVDSLAWKFFDYMGHGIPVLAPNFRDMRRIIDEVDCGWTYRSEMFLAEAIDGIAATDSVVRRAMGARGREAFLSRFSWEAQVPKFLQAVEELL